MSPFPPEANLKNPICIFCGSSSGNIPLFAKAAQSVGESLAHAKIPLVYGGGRRGIMGIVSQAALSANGYVHGIVPKALVEHTPKAAPATVTNSSDGPVTGAVAKSKEGMGQDILDDVNQEKMTVQVVNTMHERKLEMATLSTGGFIVLPGGYGTLEEVLEMIAWNQLGIHRLPILILNVGNFYTNLYKQFESSVEAGFISQENLSLLKLVNLEGGQNANSDETKATEWGQAAVTALQNWSMDLGTKLDRRKGKIDDQGKVISQDYSINLCPSYVFTTIRQSYHIYADSANHLPVESNRPPLLHQHLCRIEKAYRHFASRYGQEVWGEWPGRDLLEGELLKQERRALYDHTLTDIDDQGKLMADWRIRMIVHRGGKPEIQILRAPVGAGPFCFDIPITPALSKRPLILDPNDTIIDLESDFQKDYRLYKTDRRKMYDEAYTRCAGLSQTHPEVLIHTSTHLLETTTSNIAILLPHLTHWITPRISKTTPLLDGVLRQHLLKQGSIIEGNLSVENYLQAKQQGGRVIGFNGLRGIWEAQLL
ncbi:uncharacterized protein L203_101938 [Cryptococcus depauperatus CBS 7841]|uniref:TIGR00730 family protein n=1 Tax=Cryptococcus depauperatus CBS 7841 TaxID=1295531 RepID=A0AAJ8JQW1_9TREE